MKLSQLLSQLIKKQWSSPIEKQFAGEVEEKVAVEKLPDSEAQKFVMKLYKKYLPKLSAASDDFWDLLEGILHGVTASTKGHMKKRAEVVAELIKLGVVITEDGKIAKKDIEKAIANLVVASDYEAVLDKAIKALVVAEDAILATMSGGEDIDSSSLLTTPAELKKMNRIKDLISGLQNLVETGEKHSVSASEEDEDEDPEDMSYEDLKDKADISV